MASNPVKEVSKCCGAEFVWSPYADEGRTCYICTKCGLVCEPWLVEDPSAPSQHQAGIKSEGSEHYKTGGVELIDLIRDGGMLRHFALSNIMKYAFRNRDQVNPQDIHKIIHYANMLLEWECKK